MLLVGGECWGLLLLLGCGRKGLLLLLVGGEVAHAAAAGRGGRCDLLLLLGEDGAGCRYWSGGK